MFYGSNPHCDFKNGDITFPTINPDPFIEDIYNFPEGRISNLINRVMGGEVESYASYLTLDPADFYEMDMETLYDV